MELNKCSDGCAVDVAGVVHVYEHRTTRVVSEPDFQLLVESIRLVGRHAPENKKNQPVTVLQKMDASLGIHTRSYDTNNAEDVGEARWSVCVWERGDRRVCVAVGRVGRGVLSNRRGCAILRV